MLSLLLPPAWPRRVCVAPRSLFSWNSRGKNKKVKKITSDFTIETPTFRNCRAFQEKPSNVYSEVSPTEYYGTGSWGSMDRTGAFKGQLMCAGQGQGICPLANFVLQSGWLFKANHKELFMSSTPPPGLQRTQCHFRLQRGWLEPGKASWTPNSIRLLQEAQLRLGNM